MESEEVMPCTGPMMRTDDQVTQITNRLLEVLRTEFGFGTENLEKKNIWVDMDEKYKEQLREWVRKASDSDCCNGF
jgi:hypothetical protein